MNTAIPFLTDIRPFFVNLAYEERKPADDLHIGGDDIGCFCGLLDS